MGFETIHAYLVQNEICYSSIALSYSYTSLNFVKSGLELDEIMNLDYYLITNGGNKGR